MDLARGQRPFSRNHFRQRTLSVAVHSCDTEDLALGQRQGDILEARIEAADGTDRDTRERQQRAGVRRLIVHRSLLALDIGPQLSHVGDRARVLAEHQPHNSRLHLLGGARPSGS